MNIKQAKQEIKHTVSAYLMKDEMGEYQIPSIRQRPILLIGPPGIGKTQIMEQIARECHIGLVAYTITHHTRQSAVGLPFIKEESFDGQNYSVTEYTMSEIIASVHRKIKETGLLEGILFIDEINCVSETLAPAMLQFLQCKTFGNQAVPKGWIIVAAGNPPEYNKSVREFDMVTLDRVRSIDVTADYKVWREYARENSLYPALLSYLELRPKNFYRIEADVDGMQYVTARGWEDLSSLLYAYEKLELSVTEEIVYEFLHHREVAEDVAAYIDLYQKYRDDYGIEDILQGKVKSSVYARMEDAAFDERLSVVSLLTDGLLRRLGEVIKEQSFTDEYYVFLKEYRSKIETVSDFAKLYDEMFAEKEKILAQEEKQEMYTVEELSSKHQLLKMISKYRPKDGIKDVKEAFLQARAGFELQREKLANLQKQAGQTMEYAFDFMEQAFSNGEEMIVFVTELTVAQAAVKFLAAYECERYHIYNEKLLIGTRKGELLAELNR